MTRVEIASVQMNPPPTYDEVVDKLRPGDVLTHCFRPFPNAPYTGQGKVKQSVLRARAMSSERCAADVELPSECTSALDAVRS